MSDNVEWAIKKAAEAITFTTEHPGMGHVDWPDEWDAVEIAKVCFAVFESAQKPSDDEPTERTTNYGWAIWHLTQAKQATSVEEAQMHAACASARAQLQVSCEMGVRRGVDPNGPTLWQATEPGEEWS